MDDDVTNIPDDDPDKNVRTDQMKQRRGDRGEIDNGEPIEGNRADMGVGE